MSFRLCRLHPAPDCHCNLPPLAGLFSTVSGSPHRQLDFFWANSIGAIVECVSPRPSFPCTLMFLCTSCSSMAALSEAKPPGEESVDQAGTRVSSSEVQQQADW